MFYNIHLPFNIIMRYQALVGQSTRHCSPLCPVIRVSPFFCIIQSTICSSIYTLRPLHYTPRSMDSLWQLPQKPYTAVFTVSFLVTSILFSFDFSGIHAPPTSVTGESLSSSRLISIVMFPDVPIPDPVWTLITMTWGQIVTHDMSMSMGTTQASECDNNNLMAGPFSNIIFPFAAPAE